MSFDLLKHTPEAQYKLVALYDRHKFYRQNEGASDDMCLEIASLMQETLKSVKNLRETEIIAEILIALLRQAESNLRKAVAQTLSLDDTTPLRLILNLANDDIDVAAPLLEHSPVFSAMDLQYIVQCNGNAYGRIVAKRAGLEAALVDFLTGRRDPETSLNLVKNEKTKLTANSIKAIALMAEQHDALYAPTFARTEMSDTLIQEIYRTASDMLRMRLTEDYEERVMVQFDIALTNAVEDIAPQKSEQEERAEKVKSMMKEAEALLRNGMLTPFELLNYLKRGQVGMFAACFSLYAGLGFSATHDLLKKENGKGLAILCRACEVDKASYINMFLLSGRLRAQTIIEHSTIAKAAGYFEKIDHVLAKETLAKFRQ